MKNLRPATPTQIIAFVFLISSTNPKILQQTLTPVPTSPPQKTPLQITINTTTNHNQITVPLTQEDLNTITGNVLRPNGMIWYEDFLYTSCTGDWTIYKVNDSTGTTRTYNFGIRNAQSLHAETVNDSIQFWIPDFETGTLFHLNENNERITITTNLNRPWGISSLSDSAFIITNFRGNNAVITTRSGSTTEAITNLDSPTGITANNAHIYIANSGNSARAIEWFSKDDIINQNITIDALSTDNHTLLGGIQNVTSITMGNDNNLYFAYSLGTRGVVGRINPEECRQVGGCNQNNVEIIVYTDLAAPLTGLSLSDDMRLFLHTMFDPTIYWVKLQSPL